MTSSTGDDATGGARWRDPIIPGFHPDPSVCRVGADYYLACSSFEYFPGVPLFHSRDLRAWRQIGNILDRPGQLRLLGAPSSGGVYAPTLRHHGGRFWMVTTNVSATGHLIVNAQDPADSWSDPVVAALPGIDPDLAWDEDGICRITYAAGGQDGRPGGITQAAIDPRSGEVLEPPRLVWGGTGLAYPEAPHLYIINGLWYLLIAEGGTERGHSVSVARGPKPWGPFESCPANPVLTRRSTDSPVQSTGHADLVQDADGGWHMVFLGTRPRGGTPAYHVLGRETFHTTVQWADRWPVPDPLNRPVRFPAASVDAAAAATKNVAGAVSTMRSTVRDDFDAKRLSPEWFAVRRPAESFSDLAAVPGRLRLRGTGESLDDALPAFVGRRQQHLHCKVRALIDVTDGIGGLTIRIDEHHHYEIEAGAGHIRCTARVGPFRQEFGSLELTGPEVVLHIEAVPARGGFTSPCSPPDMIRLGVEQDGQNTVLGEIDGRYLSTEVAGGFTGRVVGMFCRTGEVAFDWFEYQDCSSLASDVRA